MEFIIAMLFGAFVSTSAQVTKAMPDCKEKNFEPKACEVAKIYHDASK